MFFEWLAGRHHCLEVIMCVVHWFSERKLCLSEIQKKEKDTQETKAPTPTGFRCRNYYWHFDVLHLFLPLMCSLDSGFGKVPLCGKRDRYAAVHFVSHAGKGSTSGVQPER